MNDAALLGQGVGGEPDQDDADATQFRSFIDLDGHVRDFAHSGIADGQPMMSSTRVRTMGALSSRSAGTVSSNGMKPVTMVMRSTAMAAIQITSVGAAMGFLRAKNSVTMGISRWRWMRFELHADGVWQWHSNGG